MCGEVNVSVSGGYVLQCAGGTRAGCCFDSVTLESWSGPKLLDPITYMYMECERTANYERNNICKSASAKYYRQAEIFELML